MWVGVTDKNWYEHLARLAPEEVNFWQPSGSRTFRILQAGEPFLFKLHSPHNYIVGGGFFVRYSALPASLAWDAFEASPALEHLHHESAIASSDIDDFTEAGEVVCIERPLYPIRKV
jgi:hypothetical protein